ncbi:MAG: NUDIX domain-containing protein [Pseudomonadota bacterium]
MGEGKHEQGLVGISGRLGSAKELLRQEFARQETGYQEIGVCAVAIGNTMRSPRQEAPSILMVPLHCETLISGEFHVSEKSGPRSNTLSRIVTAAIRPFWRMRRGMTLGSQGVVIDDAGRVLLVRHSYRAGWFFPGGGVEWGETLGEALARELEEEVGVTLTGPPELHGIFSNNANFAGDHIALYVVRRWARDGDYRQKGEIAQTGMFALDALPEPLDPGTSRRLEEIFNGISTNPLWSG